MRMDEMAKKEKVVVAMSGGVDSSLTAALLVEQGYEVIGMTMRLSEDSRDFDAEKDRGCCSLSSVDDARRVAEVIGIPHYVMNFKAMFQEKVIDYFLADYACGRTPNPCVACNRYVKFEGLLQKAMEIGAQYVATGHYARIEQDRARSGEDRSTVPATVELRCRYPILLQEGAIPCRWTATSPSVDPACASVRSRSVR